MSTVRDAYTPPLSPNNTRKVWFRVMALLAMLIIVLGATLFTAARLASNQQVRQFDTTRGPPIRGSVMTAEPTPESSPVAP